jgi:hypothetical protein
MSETNYRPTGKLQGDTKPMPDRGHSTGVTDTYGADLSGDACNCMGGIGSASKSDKPQQTNNINPVIGGK